MRNQEREIDSNNFGDSSLQISSKNCIDNNQSNAYNNNHVKEDNDNYMKVSTRTLWFSIVCRISIFFFFALCVVGVFGAGFWAGDLSAKQSPTTSTSRVEGSADNSVVNTTLTVTKVPTSSPTAAIVTSEPMNRPSEKPTSLRGTLSPTIVSSTVLPATQPPTLVPTASPTTEFPTNDLKANLTVGAYYYPWYGADFHKGSHFLRDDLSPKQGPLLGKYNDTDPAVLAQHLTWSRQANIGLWVTSWWGPGGREDITTLTNILPHTDLGSHKIALFYETNGRILYPNYTLDRVEPDIVHMCKNYFIHPNYFTIDDRPVVFVYVTRKFSEVGLLDDIVLLMRNTAARYGYDPYIIGDQVFQSAPTGEYAPFTQLDAVTNYDVRGGMNLPGNYVNQSGVDYFYSKQKEWKTAANNQGCAYVPPAVPGYNDRSIRLAVDLPAVSRRLNPEDIEGSLFRATLKGARALVDTLTNNLLMINSFNEWHEDSQIEPTIGGTTTSSPFNLTQGVEYEAYGELYLNILRQETMK
jgi:glycoprotein endo-alpha-1,2-mannosidase